MTDTSSGAPICIVTNTSKELGVRQRTFAGVVSASSEIPSKLVSDGERVCDSLMCCFGLRYVMHLVVVGGPGRIPLSLFLICKDMETESNCSDHTLLLQRG